MTQLTQQQLKASLLYNPETGAFTWLVSTTNCVKIGKIAGTASLRGYKQIRVNGKIYYEHRLAWLYMTGSWPKNQIDHINQSKGDNRWVNLRTCPRYKNSMNRPKPSNNTSGFKGVCFHNRDKLFRARIGYKGTVIYIGGYHNSYDAARAYNNKALELYGEFACLNEVPLWRLQSISKPKACPTSNT